MAARFQPTSFAELSAAFQCRAIVNVAGCTGIIEAIAHESTDGNRQRFTVTLTLAGTDSPRVGEKVYAVWVCGGTY